VRESARNLPTVRPLNPSETLCLLLNRLFPKPKLGGRESPQAYSEWEHGTAGRRLRLHDGLIELRGKRVLDGGCGLGGRTVYYAEQGCDSIVGIDIDEIHIKFAREFAERRGAINVGFSVASLDAMPFKSMSPMAVDPDPAALLAS
jgi:2-polyprenyl-3-methyl-5-hydroxy-6-metoxy-1,4-benzoquinol methylase